MLRTQPPGESIKLGFDMALLELSLSQIAPLRAFTGSLRTSAKFKAIVASVREVGIIEPPVVGKDPAEEGRYILLDGHLRIEALKELGIGKVTCLVSTDDEAFTYNKHINHLSPVQEHKMILRAIEKGVSVEKIASTLNLDKASVQKKQHLLDGICPEAADILRDKMAASEVFRLLKRMKAYRQIEAATLMKGSNCYSLSYAKVLLAATPRDQLADPGKPKRIDGISEAQMARMESEMAALQREYQLIEESYGADALNLTIAKTWLASLLGSAKVTRYLERHHPEILTQFRKIAEMTSILPREKPDQAPEAAE